MFKTVFDGNVGRRRSDINAVSPQSRDEFIKSDSESDCGEFLTFSCHQPVVDEITTLAQANLAWGKKKKKRRSSFSSNVASESDTSHLPLSRHRKVRGKRSTEAKRRRRRRYQASRRNRRAGLRNTTPLDPAPKFRRAGPFTEFKVSDHVGRIARSVLEGYREDLTNDIGNILNKVPSSAEIECTEKCLTYLRLASCQVNQYASSGQNFSMLIGYLTALRRIFKFYARYFDPLPSSMLFIKERINRLRLELWCYVFFRLYGPCKVVKQEAGALAACEKLFSPFELRALHIRFRRDLVPSSRCWDKYIKLNNYFEYNRCFTAHLFEAVKNADSLNPPHRGGAVDTTGGNNVIRVDYDEHGHPIFVEFDDMISYADSIDDGASWDNLD